MIIADIETGKCHLEGIGLNLLTEYMEITKMLAKEFPKRLIQSAFEAGFMTEDEIREEANRVEKRNVEKVKALLEILKIMGNHDTEEKPQDTFNSMFGDLFDK